MSSEPVRDRTDSPSPSLDPPTRPPGDRRLTDRTVIRGVAATSIGTWAGQAISWVSTFVVARLLLPADYGVVAMGAVFVGLVTMVNEFGIGFGVLRRRNLSAEEISGVAGMSLLFALAGAGVVLLGTWPVAAFYRTPELIPVLATQALSMVIASFRTVPLALLRRDLDFRGAAANDFLAILLNSIGMVVFAALGFGYWTLILGNLISTLVTTVLAVMRRPVRPRWPRPGQIGDVASFGGHIVLQRVCWYVYGNADVLVAAKVFGKVSAGAYSFGSTVVSSPIDKLTSLVPKVATPVFAAEQNNPAGLRRFFQLATEGLSLFAFPAAAGVALVAPDFVVGLLGTKWREAVAPMQALAVLAALRAIVPVLSPLLNMTGSEQLVTRNSIRAVIVMPLAFVIGSRWGLVGIAWAWVLGFPLVIAPLVRKALVTVDLTFLQYLAILRPAAVSTVGMIGAVLAGQRLMEGLPPLQRLIGAIGIGAVSYAAALGIGFRPRVLAILRGLRGALGARAAVTAERPAPVPASAQPADW